jgi:hypothetical protein
MWEKDENNPTRKRSRLDAYLLRFLAGTAVTNAGKFEPLIPGIGRAAHK